VTARRAGRPCFPRWRTGRPVNRCAGSAGKVQRYHRGCCERSCRRDAGAAWRAMSVTIDDENCFVLLMVPLPAQTRAELAKALPRMAGGAL
jgi:hypothetical protein